MVVVPASKIGGSCGGRAALVVLVCEALSPAIAAISDGSKPSTGMCRLHLKALQVRQNTQGSLPPPPRPAGRRVWIT